jgi:predicted molibdopterin-dependent oxidoreductase YjgC
VKPVFRELAPSGRRVAVRVDGAVRMLPVGMNLAAALLAEGLVAFRATPVSGAPRGPFCMMGACFDCLVELDGATRQACMAEVAEGMTVALPKGHGDG